MTDKNQKNIARLLFAAIAIWIVTAILAGSMIGCSAYDKAKERFTELAIERVDSVDQIRDAIRAIPIEDQTKDFMLGWVDRVVERAAKQNPELTDDEAADAVIVEASFILDFLMNRLIGIAGGERVRG